MASLVPFWWLGLEDLEGFSCRHALLINVSYFWMLGNCREFPKPLILSSIGFSAEVCLPQQRDCSHQLFMVQTSGEQSPPECFTSQFCTNDLCFLLGLPKLLLCSLPITAPPAGRGCMMIFANSFEKLSLRCLPPSCMVSSSTPCIGMGDLRREVVAVPSKPVEFSLCLLFGQYHSKVTCFLLQHIEEPCSLGAHAAVVVPPTWILRVRRPQVSHFSSWGSFTVPTFPVAPHRVFVLVSFLSRIL